MSKGILTKREREVFEYLIQNNTTKEISEKLNIFLQNNIRIINYFYS